jgi:hypothetical protein
MLYQEELLLLHDERGLNELRAVGDGFRART